MTNPIPKGGRFAALLLIPIGLLPLLFGGQRSFQHVPSPRFHDWTTRHALYSQTGTSSALEAAHSDPRAIFRWHEVDHRQLIQREMQREQLRSFLNFRFGRQPRRFPLRQASTMERDWSISLGTAGTANSMYPAKFSFDVTAAPSCANDFIAFPVNAVGSAAQANIVAFNNLYSGTAGGTGVCNRAVTANDTGVAATVMWSYNIQSVINGGVPGSPVLSFDGAKVAFVESAAGKQAHFHVLAWKTGDGRVANLQKTTSPVTISPATPFATTAPAAGSGKATDLTLSTIIATGPDTLSSPYVDYANDVAYIGNDAGYLFRIKNVFCTTGACGTSQPALDPTWGAAGAVHVCTGQLTAPVLNFFNLNVYVGCSDGKLYAISQSGTVVSLAVGDGAPGKTFGGIVDPPIVDGVNGFIYAVSGSANNGANGVMVQAKADLSSSVAVPIGSGNQCNIHAPTPNNAYFTSPTTAGALMYVAGTTGTVGPCTATGATAGTGDIFGATFTATGVMTAGAPTNKTTGLANPGNEFAPMVEFFNPHIGAGEDLLFFAVLCTGTNMDGYNITGGFPGTTNFLTPPITEGFGTSGIVVDNSALTTAGNFPQAASFYFNALNQNATCTGNTGGNTTPGTLGCAVKLTQAALQ
jgi:hypothetical protein